MEVTYIRWIYSQKNPFTDTAESHHEETDLKRSNNNQVEKEVASYLEALIKQNSNLTWLMLKQQFDCKQPSKNFYESSSFVKSSKTANSSNIATGVLQKYFRRSSPTLLTDADSNNEINFNPCHCKSTCFWKHELAERTYHLVHADGIFPKSIWRTLSASGFLDTQASTFRAET